MPDPTLVALVAGIIAWTYLVHAIVSWLAPTDWWPTGEPPEEEGCPEAGSWEGHDWHTGAMDADDVICLNCNAERPYTQDGSRWLAAMEDDDGW